MNVSFFLDVWMASLARACWQGGLVLLLVWALCRALPRLSPQVRCWLWRLAYLKLLLAFFVGGAGSLELPLLPAPRPISTAPNQGAAAPSVPAAAFVTPAAHTRPLSRVRSVTSSPGTVPASAVSLVSLDPMTATPPLLPLLVLWACGVGWFGSHLARQQREMNRLRRSYVPLEDAGLTDCCGRLCRRLGLRRPPLLLIATHDDPDGPLLTGVRRPAVLLPSTLAAECSPAEMRLVLAHELAHLRRRDLLWNWLPTLVQALFFFHPLVWVGGREWRLAQEMAADESALLVADAPVEDYGALLVQVATRHHSPRPAGSLVALRIVDSPRTLKRRLIAMTTIVPVSPNRRRVTAAALLLGATAGLLPWRAVAQQHTPPAAPIAPVVVPPPLFSVAPVKGTKAAVKAPRPAAVPQKKQPAAPVLPVPSVAPAVPVNATAARLAAPPPPARLVPATRPVIAAPLLAPAAAPSAFQPSAPAAPVVALVTAPPSTTPQALVLPPDATRQDDIGKVIDEQIEARMEAFGERIGPQMEAKGREIGALAEQLSHPDLTQERRAELTRQLTVLSQEMAGFVVPLVREAMRVAMPEIRRQTEMGVTMGKVSPAQIRGELDRALADVRSDTSGAGLSLAQRGEIEQLIREVRQEVEKGIRAGMAAREKTLNRSAAPVRKGETP